MDGSKLITVATFVGLICFVFTTFPFVIILLLNFKKEQGNNDKSIIGTLVSAIGVHLLATVALVTLITMLDIVNKSEDNFLKEKCMQSIFWKVENKSSIFTTVGAAADEVQAEGAYFVLYSMHFLIELFYAFLPFMVMFFAVFLGYQAALKRQQNDTFTIMTSILSYIIVATIVYLAWIQIANIGMFLPSGESLTSQKNDFWKDLLGV